MARLEDDAIERSRIKNAADFAKSTALKQSMPEVAKAIENAKIRSQQASERIEESKANIASIRERIAKLQEENIARKERVDAIKQRIEDIKKPPVVVPPPKIVDDTDKNKRPRIISDDGSLGSPSPSPTPATPSTVAAIPSNISPVTQTPPPPPVKTAPIDTILFDDEVVPVQIMADLIFENIGGQELINIARNDTVNGQTIIYQPIKNLTSIQQEYNPNNIVALQSTSDKYFENFAIQFDIKVPENGTGDNGAHVYIDPETGSLVIEAINLDPDEQIELEITTSGTIYEADI